MFNYKLFLDTFFDERWVVEYEIQNNIPIMRF